MRTIYDLWRKVKEHPDYIGGTVFTKGDLPVLAAMDWYAGSIDEDKLIQLTRALEDASHGNELIDYYFGN